ncbi:ABC transporter permease [Dactylosporangium sp. CA-233914]|uniref:ABC transporter permease n=1 Tax=Dactylosporangium sp. CA-233914 TaxID=3239934 RepID=UPI003D949AEE
MSASLQSAANRRLTPRNTPAVRAKRAKGGRVRGLVNYWPAAALSILLLVGVQVAVDRSWVSDLILPRPTDVWESLKIGFSSGLYLEQGRSTLTAMLGGFICATIAALTLAGLMTSSQFIDRLVMPYIVGLQSMPKIALAPLLIIWLGFGMSAKIAIVGLLAFFPIIVNALEGMKVRDRVHYELFVSFGASRWDVFWHLRLPSAMPSIFAGLRVGMVLSLLATVVAELVGAQSGLGYIMLLEKANLNIPGVFAILAIMLVMGLALNACMTLLERRLTFWAQDVSKIDF